MQFCQSYILLVSHYVADRNVDDVNGALYSQSWRYSKTFEFFDLFDHSITYFAISWGLRLSISTAMSLAYLVSPTVAVMPVFL